MLTREQLAALEPGDDERRGQHGAEGVVTPESVCSVRMPILPEHQPHRCPYIEVGARGLGLVVAVGIDFSVTVERFGPTSDGGAAYISGPRKGQRVEVQP